MSLGPYACDPALSRGRRHADVPAPTRTEYQRDRDRIVHSSAFRRLVYKTQVFVNHEGDLFRTRLTHSLEVAQLGRSIARSLALNEDLVEAVSLAHDLGHTPFGHAGQDALNGCMRDFGGFEHNLQSLRVVDWLEERYPQYDGLNLTFETREGILKHCSRRNAELLESREPHGVGERFLLGRQPSLEAQLCNLADEIAYNAHDIDDGVRSGLVTLAQLREVPLFDRYRSAAQQQYPQLADEGPGQRRLLHEAIRRMLSDQVYDVIDSTRAALARHQPASVQDVRRLPAMVCFSEGMRAQSQVLKQFLMRSLYRHPQVVQTMDAARRVVQDLFAAYMDAPQQMPPAQAGSAERGDLQRRARTVADFIAGMTDRFALREHERITGQRLLG
ncbi:deoxyguanosinetriphosphate triphosphohydrolase [Pulveribacter suum]|uniref:deoxyguanosinetriphosphate triphosphohydrolase n=1 Tax=Pulveribacter suum TaxID=2116657 RepID=UPI00221EB51B|nr:deoxyguanosinetriphosphate triphosphohydrolase [Pulveribacter suum]